jgi:hypothetical protein
LTPRRVTLVAQAASLVLLAAGMFGLLLDMTSDAPSDNELEGKSWLIAFGTVAVIALCGFLILGVVGLWRWWTRGLRKPLVYYDIFGALLGFAFLRGMFEQPRDINLIVVLGAVYGALTAVGLYLVDRYRRPAA